IHTLIEVKKKAEALPAAMQLLRYLRQTLREQPDRRFIYGMVFSKINLTLWHADRTGALASQLINIHKDPTSFVLVIVGLLASKPVDLGWDPTMKRYIMDRNTGAYKKLPSYEVDAQTTMEADDPYGRMWVVTMSQARPPPSTSTGLDDSTQAADSETLSSGEEGSSSEPELAGSQEFDEEEFVLFHALSLARAEVIRGRATRIWKAWRMADMASPAKERPVFVFKDAWRDQRRGLEGDLYDHAHDHAGKDGPGVARVYSYGEVRINGRVDDTLHMIRKGVKGQGKPLNLKTAQPKPKTVDPTHEDTYRLPSSGHFDEWSQDRFENEVDPRIERVQRNRIHSRLVMASFGYPLTKFANLLELLAALHDAIAGHQWLYENGILHRDISIGNILITGLEDSDQGILIDLDYAIKHLIHKSLWDDERSGTIAFMSYEVLMRKRYDLRPAISAKLQLQESNFGKKKTDALPGPPNVVEHDAVHDLESFFWVLCWICMARDGPGKPRVFDPAEMTVPQQWLIKIFEQRNCTNIALQKKELISSPETFQSGVLDSFSPYFEPLAPLVDALYRELRIAYMTGKFKGLHQTFLDSLKKVMEWKTIQKWHLTEKAYEAMETMERARRQLDSALWDSPKRKLTQSTTAPLKRARAGDCPTIPEAEEPEVEGEGEGEDEGDRESSPSEARCVRRRLDNAA
ncbi:hypothetical protein EWM64_g8813, partial [Hericium alpestre]